jgi:hypothetical protein
MCRVCYKLAASLSTFTTSTTLSTAPEIMIPTSWADFLAGTLSALRKDGRAR